MELWLRTLLRLLLSRENALELASVVAMTVAKCDTLVHASRGAAVGEQQDHGILVRRVIALACLLA